MGDVGCTPYAWTVSMGSRHGPGKQRRAVLEVLEELAGVVAGAARARKIVGADDAVAEGLDGAGPRMVPDEDADELEAA